jgi:hypothetical protein
MGDRFEMTPSALGAGAVGAGLPAPSRAVVTWWTTSPSAVDLSAELLGV